MNTISRLVVSLALFLAFAVSASAVEIVDFKPGVEVSSQQWKVIDLVFRSLEAAKQTTDVEFSAMFTSESGAELKILGFYNGDDQYLLRFTPPSSGKWNFVTSCSVAELDGLKGSLAVAKNESRKGGIKVDPERANQFQYANGDGYFPIAFESDWLFALDAENPDDIPVTRKFVDSLAQSGFNQIVMNVFAYDVNWPKDKRLTERFDYGSPKVFPFAGDNENPDYSRLNIEYFKRLDRVIEYLDQKGIAAHLMIYVWNKRVSWPDANSEADNRYFDYVVKRYQAYPNMIWDISKEALGYGHTDVNYITGRIDRLRELDQFDRLVTVHDYGYCRKFKKKLDFVSVQLWSSELHSVMRDVVKEISGKPILNIEHGGYERSPYVVFTGNYTSPEVCLERAYQCVFAGTFPTHYWQGAAWNVIIPDLEKLPPEQRPKFEYYRHLDTLVKKYNLRELIAGDKKSNAGFSLHNNKDLFLYYVPKECEFIGIRLPKKLRDGKMTGIWFNPFDGTFDQPVEKKISQWPAFTKPEGEGFRVLIVQIQ